MNASARSYGLRVKDVRMEEEGMCLSTGTASRFRRGARYGIASRMGTSSELEETGVHRRNNAGYEAD